jgi:divalent metal cation (Fe/Co/Zn/Cd) transporter
VPRAARAWQTLPVTATDEQQAGARARDELVTRALRLVTASVIFGLLSGTVSVVTGLNDGSLGVFAAGLGVLADVAGSAVLIWRFRAERRHPGSPHAGEIRAALIVAAALAVVAVVLTVGSVSALASGSHPGSSPLALASASVSLVVLAPLAVAKRRVGRRMASRALMGDGALSGIGAATSLLALIALVLYHALGWWWADRAAALAVAAIAAVEAWHTIPRPHPATRTVQLGHRSGRGGAEASDRRGPGG